tara:strand:- start:6097 stop:7212 length:1116 start_codon:yes stop_codon:yes gene_type:complete
MDSLIDFDDEMTNFKECLDNIKNNNNRVDLKATKLLISIMSATASMNTIINLKTLKAKLKNCSNIFDIGSMYNMTRKVSNITKNKIFYNQLTIKIRPYYSIHNKINVNSVVNIKLFRNGNMQMCGLRCEEDGLLSLKILIKQINNIFGEQIIVTEFLHNKFSVGLTKTIIDKLYNKNIFLVDYDSYLDVMNTYNKTCNTICNALNKKVDNSVIKNIVTDYNNYINILKYNITLINSDFYIGCKINRTNTYNFVLNDYNLICDYDPCIYQGVLIKFYWNYDKETQDGRCNCSVPCNGKGSGTGNGNCRKITISIFQSGNIIITGKCNRTELHYIYNYIVELLHNNYERVKQVSLGDEVKKIKRRNISILVRK